MKVKLAHDVVPYADFGVLRPYGRRLERALKFHAKFWDLVSGDFVMKELPGPASHAEWLWSWKVCVLVPHGGPGRSDQGEVGAMRFQGGVACGQVRQHVGQLLVDRGFGGPADAEREDAYTEGRLGDAGGIDLDEPWDAVFLAAANDGEFWTTEVAETALLYIA